MSLPTIMNIRAACRLTACTLVLLSLPAASSLGANPPDLAGLKIAAESGDAMAQFEYAARISAPPRPEWIVWIRKSAVLGYAPAQDALAACLAEEHGWIPKKKKAMQREAARWASRAAYGGLAAAQSRLSSYFARGVGVRKDPEAAYLWVHLAVQTEEREGSPAVAVKYKAERDVLATGLPPEKIAAMQQRAADFAAVRNDQVNPIEADLTFAELRLQTVDRTKGPPEAVLNQVRFAVGETRELKLDEQIVPLTCLAIEEKTVSFALTGTSYKVNLGLKR